METNTDSTRGAVDSEVTRDVASEIREVKRLLRAAMSGPVSQSMREGGLGYRLNFGVDQPRLADIAGEIREMTADITALAAALWKEDIRECRLLACMLMPTEAFDAEMAGVWVEQLRYAEEAQALAMHLLPRMPEACDIAFRLISGERQLDRLTGWLLFGRLFSQGKSLTQRDADEFLDQLAAELHDTTADLQLRQTALNALNRFATLGKAEEARSERVLAEIWK